MSEQIPIQIVGSPIRFYKLNEPHPRKRPVLKIKLVNGKNNLLLKDRGFEYDLYVNVSDYHFNNLDYTTKLEFDDDAINHDNAVYDAALAINLASDEYVIFSYGCTLTTNEKDINLVGNYPNALKVKHDLKWILKRPSKINGDAVIWYLQRIKKINLRNAAFDSDVRKANIKLALMEYESAMNTYVLILIFKHLFDALEIATNHDGENREGTGFDEYIESLIKVKSSTIKIWRNFYARTKHPISKIRKSEHISTLTNGMAELYNIIPELNKATKKLLHLRLDELYKSSGING